MAVDPSQVEDALAAVVGAAHVEVGDAVGVDLTHDEALGLGPVRPLGVVHPGSTDEVAAVVRWAADVGVPLTARGSGTGLSGACLPRSDGLVVAFDRMADIVEIDPDDQVAVVRPGVTLAQLDAETDAHGLVYPVFPGESSASLGGNVATNAGGMRAVRYGVTRHNVLGLTAVTGRGDVIRTGGRFVKSTSGYDLTQLVIGSEGTLALTTEAILRLHPRLTHGATILVPFPDLEHIAAAVPRVVASGIGPTILEYIDLVTMGAITANVGLDLGVPPDVQAAALAYLVVVLESRTEARVEEDTAELAALVGAMGALDVYVLPSGAGAALIDAREKAFWTAKAAGAHDIVDVVVPRSRIPDYLARCQELAAQHESLVVGCGHAGDGNVHLSVFQPDDEVRSRLMSAVLGTGVELGGAVSGEHGIGRSKKRYFLESVDPTAVELMRGIKATFDPAGVLNPGAIFD
ncbi:FAD-binding oxidoreductase [Actinomarinicola tropica]|uniref:FAD-binding protein n=1 Tax=Actinomarinicola tropica TaxID=2789776 RepID=A0A5Q2RHB3_9ACTN|nr:FAD-linked oxidase C-terminal domain-containing protein [Actinomarinicola tropica]QGG93706.1 FAD-binding protein [Actinomarinicola tropica]